MCSVDIIVPVYNAELTLEQCVTSLLSQTYKDFRIILVDDGSTDSSGDICDKYAAIDNRIIVLHKPNGGVSSARNAALDVAKGDYVTFADADDEVRPEWLSSFMETIQNKDVAVQGIEFVGGQVEVRAIGISDGLNNQSLVTKLIEVHFLGYLFGKLFRREIIESYHIRFDETIRFREDDVFVLEYARYVNSWASTDQSNYIYYVPLANKKYGSNATDCTKKIFESLNIIFSGNIPRVILDNQAWSVKGAVVNKILAGQTIPTTLLDAYRQTFSPAKGLRQRVLNFLILNSASLGSISRMILKLINRK